MKCYVFVHSYLNTTGKGIQACHAVAELMLSGNRTVREWAKKHKTLILLEGGFSQDMYSKWDDIRFNPHFAERSVAFFEDGDTLSGMLTAIAVVVGDSGCKLIDDFRKSPERVVLNKPLKNIALARLVPM